MILLKKQLFIISAILIFNINVFAQKKVACIGDSITFGARIENREENSYPAQLQNLLGNEWLVENFGNSGSTLLKKGNKPYWNQKEFNNAINANPDIVIIKLGTNDTKPDNIKFKKEFVDNYVELINIFKELPSKPKIYICLPVPAFPGNFKITNKVLVSKIIPRIKKIAKKTKVDLIDLYTPLKNDAAMFPDKIHPNKEGAAKIADIIAKQLL
ncbi:hypothetical protein AXE80_02455 [Wenyingzhuangia fucanilytica]|uniref:SGNH hydrolase-type esterase domain-containing protein n=1 Tax=Wenyingzhuangia fucanilytica TaxID=1790137 RepID=A0A1B1Y373_9FLAO|nr:GDSL-type esterase/lipase family protein [Wenyingzhuangia fucanilytica]ANW95213.1 hypothetical protein AXE80_02455 [Wenyingzhuangia fucanilytica]